VYSPTYSDQEDWGTFTPPVVERSKTWDLQFELIQEIKKDLDGWDTAVETSGDELEAKKWSTMTIYRGQNDARVIYEFEVNK